MFKPDKNYKLKVGLAEMLKGGVIMDVTTPDQAKIAEDAGAVSVMALERIPADIREHGGVARMSNPSVIKKIMDNYPRGKVLWDDFIPVTPFINFANSMSLPKKWFIWPFALFYYLFRFIF